MRPQGGQNESALVCAARQGDKEAFRLLLTRNWTWLRALVCGIVHRPDDVDDVLQDICLRVINKIHTLREPERFRPWLAVVAQRQALRFRQQKAKGPVSLTDEVANRQCDEKANQLLENIQQKEQYRQILQAVCSLPEKYRQVFMLEHITDMTYARIAEILDVPVTTVQIRLVRARRMILERVAGKNKSKVTER